MPDLAICKAVASASLSIRKSAELVSIRYTTRNARLSAIGKKVRNARFFFPALPIANRSKFDCNNGIMFQNAFLLSALFFPTASQARQ